MKQLSRKTQIKEEKESISNTCYIFQTPAPYEQSPVELLSTKRNLKIREETSHWIEQICEKDVLVIEVVSKKVISVILAALNNSYYPLTKLIIKNTEEDYSIELDEFLQKFLHKLNRMLPRIEWIKSDEPVAGKIAYSCYNRKGKDLQVELLIPAGELGVVYQVFKIRRGVVTSPFDWSSDVRRVFVEGFLSASNSSGQPINWMEDEATKMFVSISKSIAPLQTVPEESNSVECKVCNWPADANQVSENVIKRNILPLLRANDRSSFFVGIHHGVKLSSKQSYPIGIHLKQTTTKFLQGMQASLNQFCNSLFPTLPDFGENGLMQLILWRVPNIAIPPPWVVSPPLSSNRLRSHLEKELNQGNEVQIVCSTEKNKKNLDKYYLITNQQANKNHRTNTWKAVDPKLKLTIVERFVLEVRVDFKGLLRESGGRSLVRLNSFYSRIDQDGLHFKGDTVELYYRARTDWSPRIPQLLANELFAKFLVFTVPPPASIHQALLQGNFRWNKPLTNEKQEEDFQQTLSELVQDPREWKALFIIYLREDNRNLWGFLFRHLRYYKVPTAILLITDAGILITDFCSAFICGGVMKCRPHLELIDVIFSTMKPRTGNLVASLPPPFLQLVTYPSMRTAQPVIDEEEKQEFKNWAGLNVLSSPFPQITGKVFSFLGSWKQLEYLVSIVESLFQLQPGVRAVSVQKLLRGSGASTLLASVGYKLRNIATTLYLKESPSQSGLFDYIASSERRNWLVICDEIKCNGEVLAQRKKLETKNIVLLKTVIVSSISMVKLDEMLVNPTRTADELAHLRDALIAAFDNNVLPVLAFNPPANFMLLVTSAISTNTSSVWVKQHIERMSEIDRDYLYLLALQSIFCQNEYASLPRNYLPYGSSFLSNPLIRVDHSRVYICHTVVAYAILTPQWHLSTPSGIIKAFEDILRPFPVTNNSHSTENILRSAVEGRQKAGGEKLSRVMAAILEAIPRDYKPEDLKETYDELKKLYITFSAQQSSLTEEAFIHVQIHYSRMLKEASKNHRLFHYQLFQDAAVRHAYDAMLLAAGTRWSNLASRNLAIVYRDLHRWDDSIQTYAEMKNQTEYSEVISCVEKLSKAISTMTTLNTNRKAELLARIKKHFPRKKENEQLHPPETFVSIQNVKIPDRMSLIELLNLSRVWKSSLQ